jgi:3-oxoacyl-[acyl-carrier protein] reductase
MSAVLVTGGTGGLGQALCRLLAAQGLTPIIGHRSDGALAEGLAEETGGLALELDMSDWESIDTALENLKNMENPPGALVLCASPPPVIGPFTRIKADDLNGQWQVNVIGAQHLLAGVIKGCFRRQKTGTVVAVLTAAMGLGEAAATSNMGAYIIAKYGLRGVLKAAAAEFNWLRCQEVAPGFMETNMLKAFDDRFLDMERDRRPEGRFSTAEEVAAEILPLLFEQAVQ